MMDINMSTLHRNTSELRWPAGCPPDDNATEYLNFFLTAQFINGLILYPITCFIGIIGNCITMVVLTRRKMVTSTNIFLTAMSVADSLKLANDIIYFVMLVVDRHNPKAANFMQAYVYPYSHYIFNEALCVTAWLTVSVSVERYISVCYATKAKQLCTVGKARIASALVYLTMSLLALPSLLRYRSLDMFNPRNNTTEYKICLTELGQHKNFAVYSWIINLLRSVIPIVLLIILNSRIIHVLRKQRVKGKKMAARNKITWMLIIVVVVFVVCVIPDAFMSTIFGFGYVDESNLVKGIREFTDYLLAVNSAVNFIIYCVFSKVFRDTFFELCCDKVSNDKGLTLLSGAGSRRHAQPLGGKTLVTDGHTVTIADGPESQV